MTALHTPIISRLFDIPSLSSASSIRVRVRVSVRRCCRFSELYAFHSSGSDAVGIQRRRIAVGTIYKATASRTLALLQCVGHRVRHIRSKSAFENNTGDGARRGVGPRLLILMVRLLVLWYFGSHARWVRGSIPPLTPHAVSSFAQSSPIHYLNTSNCLVSVVVAKSFIL